MSKVVHAKPVWGWSHVLLSTLLLAPGASTAALHAALLLAQVQTAPAPLARVPAAPAPTPGPAAETVAAPRRADDEWAQRLRVQDSRSLTLLGGPTGFAPSDTLAILVPARLVVLVPDEGDAPRGFAPSSAPRARAAAFDAATPPRAPPFVSPA